MSLGPRETDDTKTEQNLFKRKLKKSRTELRPERKKIEQKPTKHKDIKNQK